jgi:hypothetical protein
MWAFVPSHITWFSVVVVVVQFLFVLRSGG